MAFKTAETNDLDKPENRDLLSPKCRVRAVITKAALAEGWDCPFAYVLCALAANGNEAAMTQLVGRILRQPHATKTDVPALDECYVFAHRADTSATVAAIKKGLEGDGLGDLATDVVLSSGATSTGEATMRTIARREEFRAAAIALPKVLIRDGQTLRELDVETDLHPKIDWSKADLDALAGKLPKDAQGADYQLVRLHTGAAGLEAETGAAVVVDAGFDAAYAARQLSDIVPNAFIAWALVDTLLGKLRALGWSGGDLSRLAALIVSELRKALEGERERQAAALFDSGLDDGTILFALHGDGHDWRAPATITTTQPEHGPKLSSSTGGPLARSLFLPIFTADLNDAEQRAAVYLDRQAALRWWHRNGAGSGSYGLRGWRRGNVYPDFLMGAVRDGAAGDRIVVIETKGEQLGGNADTTYKAALLDRLTLAFRRSPGSSTQLQLGAGASDYRAALVLFGDLETRFPSLIHDATLDKK